MIKALTKNLVKLVRGLLVYCPLSLQSYFLNAVNFAFEKMFKLISKVKCMLQNLHVLLLFISRRLQRYNNDIYVCYV